MHSFDGGAIFGGHFEMIRHMNALDYQDATVFFDLALAFRHQKTFASGYFARCQRASKGTRQSTSGRGDHVVDGRRVRLMYVLVHAVMFGDF